MKILAVRFEDQKLELLDIEYARQLYMETIRAGVLHLWKFFHLENFKPQPESSKSGFWMGERNYGLREWKPEVIVK